MRLFWGMGTCRSTPTSRPMLVAAVSSARHTDTQTHSACAHTPANKEAAPTNKCGEEGLVSEQKCNQPRHDIGEEICGDLQGEGGGVGAQGGRCERRVGRLRSSYASSRSMVGSEILRFLGPEVEPSHHRLPPRPPPPSFLRGDGCVSLARAPRPAPSLH